MAKQTLNAGLIGYGMIGKVHAYSTAVLPWYAPELPIVGRIVAVATSRMETALRAQENLGSQTACDDYRKIIDAPSIDVVHICTPNDQHLPALIAAIRANKYIYCEKPLVADQNEAQELRRVLAETQYARANQLAHFLRGFAALRRAKELIDAGRLGQLVQYRAGYYHSSMLDPVAPWRWKHGAKGGTNLDLASHLVDLVGWLVGLPAEVLANATTLTPSRPERPLKPGESLDAVPFKPVEAEDSVTILTRGLHGGARVVPKLPSERVWEAPENSGDASTMPLAVADPDASASLTGVIEATKLMSGTEDDLTLEICGTRGSLRFSLMNPHYLEYFDATEPSGVYGGDSGWKKIHCGGRYPSPESDFPSPKSSIGWVRAHVASLAAFYRSISDGHVHGADFEQALKVQDALAAIAESARKRVWVSL
ncbi:MAG: Gfo/Idh/MocA family protein [Thermoguttaceae bacterium]|jgi:predicted dehydrogenase